MSAGSTCTTDALENRIINISLRGFKTISGSPYAPYIGLFTSTTASGYETGCPTEVSTTGYQRASASGADVYSPDPSTPTLLLLTNVSNPWLVSGASAINLYEIRFPFAHNPWGNANGVGIVSGSWRMASGSQLFFYSFPETVYNLFDDYIFYLPANSMHLVFNDIYSSYWGNTILNWMLNKVSPTLPGTNVEIALFSSIPDIYNNNGVEIPKIISTGTSTSSTGAGAGTGTSTGYNRKLIAGTSNWAAPVTGSTIATGSLVATLNWTAIKDWGFVEGFGLYDTETNNLLFRGRLERTRQILTGDTFSIGSFKVIID